MGDQSEETHTVKPVGLGTVVTRRSPIITTLQKGVSAEGYYTRSDENMDYDPYAVIRYQLVVDIPKIRLKEEANVTNIVANIDVGPISMLKGITSLMGITGPALGLDKFEDTLKAGEAAGVDADTMALLISETIMQFVDVYGATLETENFVNGVAAGNEYPTQYHGQTPVYCMFDTNAGDLAEAFLVTPAQLKQLHAKHDNMELFYNPAQLPVFLRPVSRQGMLQGFESWIDLWFKSPTTYNKLVRNAVVHQVALTNSIESFLRFIRSNFVFGLYAFLKSTGMTLVPIEAPNMGDRTQKFQNPRVYEERPPNFQRDFELDKEEKNATYKLDTSAGKIEKCANLRRAFMRFGSRMPNNDDVFNADDIIYSMATEPETICTILLNMLGLIVGTKTSTAGSTFTGHLQTVIDRENIEIDAMEKNQQNPYDEANPRGFIVNDCAKLDAQIINTVLVGFNKRNIKTRSEYEFFDLTNTQGKYLGNPGTVAGTNGRMGNIQKDFGAALNVQYNSPRKGVLSVGNYYLTRINKVVGFFNRTNSAGMKGSAYFTGMIRLQN